MSVNTKKGSARKSKHMPVKTSLNNPYALQWNTLDAADMHFILESLEEVLKQIGFKKIETRRKKKPFSGKKQGKEQCQTHATKHRDADDAENVIAHGWTDVQVRKQLAIGINEVTRALEKNELLLVLVCKSAKPLMLTSHLIPLCASRAVPAGQVPRLSENLAPLLGLTSVLALGFKRDTNTFADVAKVIIPRIPSLHVPWIQHRAEQPPTTNPLPVDLQTAELVELNPDEASPTLKRKRTENSMLVSSNTALQLLSIKQIVPNPNKRKKLPKTKKRISK